MRTVGGEISQKVFQRYIDAVNCEAATWSEKTWNDHDSSLWRRAVDGSATSRPGAAQELDIAHESEQAVACLVQASMVGVLEADSRLRARFVSHCCKHFHTLADRIMHENWLATHTRHDGAARKQEFEQAGGTVRGNTSALTRLIRLLELLARGHCKEMQHNLGGILDRDGGHTYVLSCPVRG